MTTIRAALVLLVSIVCGAGSAFATDWPQTRSDLAADPSVTFGVLGNGMRYAIQRNGTPAHQVAMRFLVLAGSNQEAHDQEGLAHLLEHMAFHGSTHVADGDMTHILERLGMGIGADVNAFTTRASTVYKFNLSRGDDTSLDDALLLYREIASELILDPKAMDAERKVVLAEGRARPAPVQELESNLYTALYGQQAYARPPIGRTEVIENAPVARLRDF